MHPVLVHALDPPLQEVLELSPETSRSYSLSSAIRCFAVAFVSLEAWASTARR